MSVLYLGVPQEGLRLSYHRGQLECVPVYTLSISVQCSRSRKKSNVGVQQRRIIATSTGPRGSYETWTKLNGYRLVGVWTEQKRKQ